ncbi:glycosyltransferase family A protein [Mucilaginibacter pedocola]|uniref:Glycosyltransferase 2-like domain-containing protein n=1 Tax=Mucilaginibacter pedocola TaxID=1792845 RepID=A0A1S9PAW5_9SPHI|nr:glycosyltransferase family 2 protein [Mucilaginibacter pedocola]OOQ58071.1 hypothetical protein BC343_10450 [Mucilaginibacter pedocola]
MELGVSVIICCYNSAKRLPQTLKHLAAQQVPANIPWEVIVIDNASTDDTYALASQLWEAENTTAAGFKLLRQPIPGKNHAFNMGVEQAKFEFILTCDDDNWLNPNYIHLAYDIMLADSKIGALGGFGIIEPEQPALLPQAELEKITVHSSQTWATEQHWVYGAGSVYRKSILTNLAANNWQQVTKGRTGTSLICGEDVEFCFIFYLSGYKIIADDRLTFKHFIPHGRQNAAYIAKLSYWMAYTNVLLYSYFAILNQEKKPIERVLKNWLFSTAKAIIKQNILLVLKPFKSASAATHAPLQLKGLGGTFNALRQNSKRIVKHHYHIKNLLTKINSPQQTPTPA